MDWTIRVEETRIGLTDDGEFVIILRHVRNRGSHTDWQGTITRTGNGGAVVMRDTAPDAETLMILCKEWLAQHAAVRERDPFTRNERDPFN